MLGIVNTGFRDTEDAEGNYPPGVYGALARDDAAIYKHFTESEGVWAAVEMEGAFDETQRLSCSRKMKSGAKQVLVKAEFTEVVACKVILRTFEGMRLLGGGARWNELTELRKDSSVNATLRQLEEKAERTVPGAVRDDLIGNLCNFTLPSEFRHSLELFFLEKLGTRDELNYAVSQAKTKGWKSQSLAVLEASPGNAGTSNDPATDGPDQPLTVSTSSGQSLAALEAEAGNAGTAMGGPTSH